MLSNYLNRHFVLAEIVVADETGHFYSSVTLIAADGTRVVLEPDAIDHGLGVGTKDAMLPTGVIAASVEEPPQ